MTNTPDLDQAQCHLALLDPEAETFVFQTFDDSEKKDPALARVISGPLENCAQLLIEMNRRGAGIFVTVNESINDRRRKTDIVTCRAIWREADKPGLAPLPIQPHLTIETSPGKFHEYLLTRTNDLDTCDAIMRTMVIVHGSDPNAKDRSRVLRLAGFFHCKKAPHMVRIIGQNDRPRYTLEQITQHIPPAKKPTSDLNQNNQTGNVKTKKYAATALSSELTELACAPEHTRNDQLNRAAYSLGQLIAGGELDLNHVQCALTAAAIGIGLHPNEVQATIRSGINAGMAKPRTAPKQIINKPCPTPGGLEDKWPELLPLGPDDPPPLPIHLWPPVLRDYATEAAAETETPVELPALLALGLVSTAIQRVAAVEIKPGYGEPCCLYVAVVLPPATRKSREYARVIRPLVHWESEKRKALADIIAKAESLHATHKARVIELRKRVVKATDKAKAATLAAELSELEAEEPKMPNVPRVFTSDVTTEHLATMMGRHNGVMAVIASEGGIFEIMAGRYNNQVPNIDLYLQAHAGDPVRVDRGSRPPIVLDNPRLTMVLTIQPDVLAGLNTKPGFRGRGLLGRIMFCLPPSHLGSRKGDAPPMRADIEAAFNRTVTCLLNVSDQSEPYTLEIEPDAYDAWLAYWREVEADLADGGAFEYLRDWAGKLPGAVGRMAALFHSARFPQELDTRSVSAEDMRAAIETGRALAGHALVAFGQMGADPAVEDAKLILRWIERHAKAEFTKRNAHMDHKSRFQMVDELEPGLGVLEHRGYIRQRTGETGKPGRPTKVYEVNPICVQ